MLLNSLKRCATAEQAPEATTSSKQASDIKLNPLGSNAFVLLKMHMTSEEIEATNIRKRIMNHHRHH